MNLYIYSTYDENKYKFQREYIFRMNFDITIDKLMYGNDTSFVEQPDKDIFILQMDEESAI